MASMAWAQKLSVISRSEEAAEVGPGRRLLPGETLLLRKVDGLEEGLFGLLERPAGHVNRAEEVVDPGLVRTFSCAGLRRLERCIQLPLKQGRRRRAVPDAGLEPRGLPGCLACELKPPHRGGAVTTRDQLG